MPTPQQLLKAIAVVVLACVALSAPVEANLLTNGNFQTNNASNYLSNGDDYDYYAGTALPGWTVGTTTGNHDVSVIPNDRDATHLWSIDLTGDTDSPAWAPISQTFATVVGQAYTLTFGLSSYWLSSVNCCSTGPMTVSVTGSSSLLSHALTAPTNGVSGTYDTANESFSFVANSTTSTLTFQVTSVSSVQGVYVSNADVELVPEPAAWVIVGSVAPLVLLRRRAAILSLNRAGA